MLKIDKTYLINLDRRPDRLEAFRERFPARIWPFPQPERVQALDGQKIPKPSFYTQQEGAYGCLHTHKRLYEDALNNEQDIFIWEDDCVFAPDFAKRAPEFFAAVPDDWDMVYLGGLHRMPPVTLSGCLHLGRAITTTYAYAVSHRFLRTLYPLLMEAEQHHIDQMLARLMAAHTWKIYCPVPWLVGMDAGPSDICSRYYQRPHFWEWKPRQDREPVYLNQLLARQELREGVWQDCPLTAAQQRPAISSTIGGWFSDLCGAAYRKECRRLARESAGHVCKLAEVGCWRGRSLSYLADLINTGEVEATAIDHWKGCVDPRDPTHGMDVYAHFLGNMQRLGMRDRLNILRQTSAEACATFTDGSLDVVLIDASHDYPSIKQDIALWWPKVRPGGVLMGHDYSPQCACPGVVRAVDEFAVSLGQRVRTEADLWVFDKGESR